MLGGEEQILSRVCVANQSVRKRLSTGLVNTNGNYQGRALCYLSSPKAEADNTWYHEVRLFITEVHLLCYLICLHEGVR